MDEKIQLHIWSRKELENYLLIPETITRLIATKSRTRKPPSVSEVEREMDQIIENLKDDVIASFTTSAQEEGRSVAGTAYLSVKKRIDDTWKNRETRWALVSGKKVLSALSDWSKRTYGISFGIVAIARTLLREEVPEEMALVLQAIEKGQHIDSKARSSYS